MPTRSLRVLLCATVPAEVLAGLAASPFGAFDIDTCADAQQLQAQLAAAACDALIVDVQAARLNAAMVESLAADVALLLLVPVVTPQALDDWLTRGVQDLLDADALNAAGLAPRLRGAVERKRHERDTRRAYSTDLETGLPHQQQLVEHMSHLLALREREPAPMALLVLRIEGLGLAQLRLGADAAHVLRRKLGVRLRAGVRASDVVAALGDDSFGVLLAALLAPADAQRVGAKLLAALKAPLTVAGQDVAIATALGIAQYPQDGVQPDALLRRAAGLAASAPAEGRGAATAGAASAGAANDE